MCRLILLAFGIVLTVVDVVRAWQHGILTPRVYETLTPVPYLLIIGMVATLIALSIRGIRCPEGGLCFLIWSGYSHALVSITPDNLDGAVGLDWMLSMFGAITVGTIIVAGYSYQEMRKNGGWVGCPVPHSENGAG